MRSILPARPVIVALTLGMVAPSQAFAQAASPAGGITAGTLLPGASSHEPISIEASRLDYFDKEQKLVYTGDVHARQGETTLRGSVVTIYLTKDATKAQSAGGADAKQAGSSVRRMEITGPVTVTSKDEVGTGDNGVYDKASNQITLTGNVVLTQDTNVVKGNQLVYDMDSGRAHVYGAPGKPMVSVFTPQSGTARSAGSKKAKGASSASKAKTAPASQAAE